MKLEVSDVNVVKNRRRESWNVAHIKQENLATYPEEGWLITTWMNQKPKLRGTEYQCWLKLTQSVEENEPTKTYWVEFCVLKVRFLTLVSVFMEVTLADIVTSVWQKVKQGADRELFGARINGASSLLMHQKAFNPLFAALYY